MTRWALDALLGLVLAPVEWGATVLLFFAVLLKSGGRRPRPWENAAWALVLAAFLLPVAGAVLFACAGLPVTAGTQALVPVVLLLMLRFRGFAGAIGRFFTHR
ncbi:hypothetical protein ACIQWA_31080 [Kitasatospora sp. NPDC098652]|uniref:hypothetical protein n=1 Tax=Kitasatospora sp. NPDC098652 TaxID=3364095 RepID=UPI0037FC945A